MALPEFTIAPDFSDAGVSVRLGVLIYEVPVTDQDVSQVVTETIEETKALLGDRKPAELERVKATRSAFKALGKDPSRYRPSSEALLRRIASGKGLYSVGSVVDVNNVISLKTQLPIGTYDLSKIDGDILFRRGLSGETYQGVGRSELNLEDLALFADAKGPFGTPFSDSERTKVEESTREVMSVLVSLNQDGDLRSELDTSRALFETVLNARTQHISIIQDS